MYLIYSYQYNKELLLKGLYRGHDEELLGHYRRECLLVSSFTRTLVHHEEWIRLFLDTTFL